MAARIRPVREADIQKQLLHWLALQQIPAWRFNGGAMSVGNRFVRFNTARGCSDILGVLPPSGRLLAVEVKTRTGKLTDLQSDFLDTVRAAGGLAIVARSIEDLETALRLEGLLT